MTAPSADRGAAVQAAIALFHGIAASAGDALATEGPVHADHQLLGLCADALHHLNQAERLCAQIRQEVDEGVWTPPDGKMDALQGRHRALMAEAGECRRRAMPILRAIGKIKATTPAGIYAKAMACRASTTGSAVLAKSLADDLLACQALRALLWPGEVADAAGGDAAERV